MSYIYLVLSLLALGTQGVFYFMIVAFIGGNEPAVGLVKLLNISIYALPTVCLIAAMFLLVGFFQHWDYVYRWILLPIPFAVLFVILRFSLFK